MPPESFENFEYNKLMCVFSADVIRQDFKMLDRNLNMLNFYFECRCKKYL